MLLIRKKNALVEFLYKTSPKCLLTKDNDGYTLIKFACKNQLYSFLIKIYEFDPKLLSTILFKYTGFTGQDNFPVRTIERDRINKIMSNIMLKKYKSIDLKYLLPISVIGIGLVSCYVKKSQQS